MKLISFSVTNFRSITKAHKIPIGQSTVLVGRNNEGKSNLLRALAISMNSLIRHAAEDARGYLSRNERSDYNWGRDFPISLQGRARSTESIFRLEFSLSDYEIIEFRSEVGSSLNGTLPIEIKLGKKNTAEIHVPKRGRGGNSLSAKSKIIAEYISTRIQFNYIPAIRTEDESLAVVQRMLSKELVEIEKNPDYQAALQKISELQQPVLDRVSAAITDALRIFLPTVTEVFVSIPPAARRSALRNQCLIEIDDGSRTLLEYKGDGVKSLAALGLLRSKTVFSGASIIAIEEPESHLHPGAMHSLREVLETLTEGNQLVITTHCPLFVERGNISRNIIVDSNNAKTSKDISSIRQILGIKASDNLVNASYVLVVEGVEDVIALTSLLPYLSPELSKAMKLHQLVIEQIGGASNLSYKLTQLNNSLCVTHVLLDNDAAGRKAYEKAESEKTIKMADITFLNCPGMPDSEFEDCLDKAVYEQEILSQFGVTLSVPEFRSNKKWSDRVKACFEKQGKPWSSKLEAQVKAVTAEVVAKNPSNALNSHKRSTIDALVTALEQKISKL